MQGAQIKIEVNTTIRGHVFPARVLDVADAMETEFGRFASANVVSNAELFGGKICAALDRQHPRDLFDVHHKLAGEGFTDEIQLGFIASLISHPSTSSRTHSSKPAEPDQGLREPVRRDGFHAIQLCGLRGHPRWLDLRDTTRLER